MGPIECCRLAPARSCLITDQLLRDVLYPIRWLSPQHGGLCDAVWRSVCAMRGAYSSSSQSSS